MLFSVEFKLESIESIIEILIFSSFLLETDQFCQYLTKKKMFDNEIYTKSHLTNTCFNNKKKHEAAFIIPEHNPDKNASNQLTKQLTTL